MSRRCLGRHTRFCAMRRRPSGCCRSPQTHPAWLPCASVATIKPQSLSAAPSAPTWRNGGGWLIAGLGISGSVKPVLSRSIYVRPDFIASSRTLAKPRAPKSFLIPFLFSCNPGVVCALLKTLQLCIFGGVLSCLLATQNRDPNLDVTNELRINGLHRRMWLSDPTICAAMSPIRVQHPLALTVHHDSATKILLAGKELFALRWSVDSIASFPFGIVSSSRQAQLYITIRSASCGLLFFPKMEDDGDTSASYTESNDGSSVTYGRKLSFNTAGSQSFEAMVGWRPDSRCNEDASFEIGLQWQRKDGTWINPVAYDHTIRKVRGYTGHGNASVLVITHENTNELHVDQLAQAAHSYNLGSVLEFWNVDHPQGLSFEQVTAEFRNRMVFDMSEASTHSRTAPTRDQVLRAIVQLHLRYWQATDASEPHSLAGIDRFMTALPMPSPVLGRAGLVKALNKESFRLPMYTRFSIDAPGQACSWFNPSKRYANARLAARAQRYVNEYRKVFPHDDVGFSFTKSPEKKTFFSKATIGSVSLYRLTDIGEKHVLQAQAMPPKLPRAMPVAGQIEAYITAVQRGNEAEIAGVSAALHSSLFAECEIVGRRKIRGGVRPAKLQFMSGLTAALSAVQSFAQSDQLIVATHLRAFVTAQLAIKTTLRLSQFRLRSRFQAMLKAMIAVVLDWLKTTTVFGGTPRSKLKRWLSGSDCIAAPSDEAITPEESSFGIGMENEIFAAAVISEPWGPPPFGFTELTFTTPSEGNTPPPPPPRACTPPPAAFVHSDLSGICPDMPY
eukprot:m.187899 g.187899  ORF g.187899 m.187899 type:complete len:787 (+) comp24806_c2_seq7:1258-3618(+)